MGQTDAVRTKGGAHRSSWSWDEILTERWPNHNKICPGGDHALGLSRACPRVPIELNNGKIPGVSANRRELEKSKGEGRSTEIAHRRLRWLDLRFRPRSAGVTPPRPETRQPQHRSYRVEKGEEERRPTTGTRHERSTVVAAAKGLWPCQGRSRTRTGSRWQRAPLPVD